MSPNKTCLKEKVMPEHEYIDSAGLAVMIDYSKKFIEKHRQSIVGAVKIGGCWRFHIAEIRARLATGRDIIIKPLRGGGR